jgi:hypothetical protein
MQRFPQMLYRAGGSEEIHGGRFATLIVADESALSAALADGWRETTGAALEALHVSPDAPATEPADDAPPTRDELEQKARELGIKFDGRTGDKKLASLIAEKLKG